MNIMEYSLPGPRVQPMNGFSCQSTLSRLIGNLRGFAYRRRADDRWTMDFVSTGCRDVTGYDPHRFMENGSIAFSDLIERSDRRRVNERVRLAARLRQRVTIRYMLRTAYGMWVQVEDRLTPVVNAAGQLLAIDGIIDHASRGQPPLTGLPLPRVNAR